MNKNDNTMNIMSSCFSILAGKFGKVGRSPRGLSRWSLYIYVTLQSEGSVVDIVFMDCYVKKLRLVSEMQLNTQKDNSLHGQKDL